MKKLVIFSGTTEGRVLSEKLAGAGIPHKVSVATEYGELVMRKHPLVEIHHGRLSEEQMLEFLRDSGSELVIDATHPYATEVTRILRACVDALAKGERDIAYLRLERQIEEETVCHLFLSNEACSKALGRISGNILLTTGSKELGVYCQSEELKKRLFVRVLPGMESLTICKEMGLLPKQILALQGPFQTQMNLAILQQYHISCMVSKLGGITGGFPEKQEACRLAGIPLYVVQKERACELQEGEHTDSYHFAEICAVLEQRLGVSLLGNEYARLSITMAGVGMGNAGSMTQDTARVVKDADIIIGADRVIKSYVARLEKKAAYMPEEITEWLILKSREYAAYDNLQVVILFSGDSGFYSGCQKVQQVLQEAIAQKGIRATLQIYPGISSVQAMAAACGVSWQNAGIYSIHGRTSHIGWERELQKEIQQHETLFLLVSGAKDIRTIGTLLDNQEQEYQGEDFYQIYVGYQLSYPEEEVRCLTPNQCSSVEKEGLYTVMIKHKVIKQQSRNLTPGIGDDQFIRGKIPMTKKEIRHISVCKLQLEEQAVLYDIGSGTGTIAVESARLHPSITVYAIEQKKEAVELERQNCKKFQAYNIKIIEGKAPEILEELERPTHAFIGGSSGNMLEILECLYRKNRTMRIVINATSLETVAVLHRIEKDIPIEHFEMVQVQVNRYEKVGAYHLSKAENPIMICSFQFRE